MPHLEKMFTFKLIVFPSEVYKEQLFYRDTLASYFLHPGSNLDTREKVLGILDFKSSEEKGCGGRVRDIDNLKSCQGYIVKLKRHFKEPNHSLFSSLPIFFLSFSLSFARLQTIWISQWAFKLGILECKWVARVLLAPWKRWIVYWAPRATRLAREAGEQKNRTAGRGLPGKRASPKGWGVGRVLKKRSTAKVCSRSASGVGAVKVWIQVLSALEPHAPREGHESSALPALPFVFTVCEGRAALVYKSPHRAPDRDGKRHNNSGTNYARCICIRPAKFDAGVR